MKNLRFSVVAILCGVLVSACVTSHFSYYQPEKSAYLLTDRWGTARVYFREVAPDVFLYLASTERSDGRTMLLRISLPFSQRLDASGAVALIGPKEEQLTINFLRGFATTPNSIHLSDLPDFEYSALPVPRPAKPVWSHQLIEASLPLSGDAESMITIRGIRVGGVLLEPVTLRFMLKSGTFRRMVPLQ